MSDKLLKEIKTLKQMIAEMKEVTEWVNIDEAAKILGFETSSTVTDYIGKKKIPADWYRINNMGKKFFDVKKLKGLKP